MLVEGSVGLKKVVVTANRSVVKVSYFERFRAASSFFNAEGSGSSAPEVGRDASVIARKRLARTKMCPAPAIVSQTPVLLARKERIGYSPDVASTNSNYISTLSPAAIVSIRT
jgi:hypothetical protein